MEPHIPTMIRHLSDAIEKAERVCHDAERAECDTESQDTIGALVVAGVVLQALRAERNEWVSRQHAATMATWAAEGVE